MTNGPGKPERHLMDLRSTTVRVTKRGQALINDRLLNKGTAFSREERQDFGLDGLLPNAVATMQQQVKRVYDNIMRKPDALERYIGLVGLQDRNETLFYRLLLDHIEEFLPIVYTPTVGLACQKYSHNYRRPRGLWITPGHRGQIEKVLANAQADNVRLIVVTDNERILGLGDLGAGGIGIPIGKLALYSAAAGIQPQETLPISLDVGTDNEELLKDDLYLGWREPRLRGEAYDELVDEFVQAVKRRYPGALLQWEDFKKQNAFRLLERYRQVLPSFNDDIQGTAAVSAAAMLAGARLKGQTISDQRVMFFGAGAAGVGIARQVREVMRQDGLDGDALRRAIIVLDSKGVLHEGREITEETKRPFAWPVELVKAEKLPMDKLNDLAAVIDAYKPTILLGTSGQPGVFTEAAVRAMARNVEKPIILPLSNPNSKAEAKPADLVQWTKAKAVVATGGPWDPIQWEGRTVAVTQVNNVYVFPGIGLGALVAEAREVTDTMFNASVFAFAGVVKQEHLDAGMLFPPLGELRDITRHIGEAVARQAREDGVGRKLSDSEISTAVADAMWEPNYPKYEAVGG